MTFSGPAEHARAGVEHALDVLAAHDRVIAVGVSGGSDSLALLVLACAWARRRGRRVAAATVDHGLRAEAAEEARGVALLCGGLGIEHAILTWRLEEGHPVGPVSQAQARQARHRLLAGWARTIGVTTIALGHTADDRAETVAMRLRAGSGWWGLAGPLPMSPSPIDQGDHNRARGLSFSPVSAGPGFSAVGTAHNLRLVRPALGVRREHLRAALRAAGMGWIEDPSNALEKFERVRTRRLLGRLGPEAHEGLVRIADGCALMRAAVMAAAHEGLAGADADADSLRLNAGAFRALGREGRLRLVEAMVMAAAARSLPPRLDAVGRLAEGLARLEPARAATLGGAIFRARRGAIEVQPAPLRRGGKDGGEAKDVRATPLDASPPPSLRMDVVLARARALLENPGLEAIARAGATSARAAEPGNLAR